MSTSLKPTSPDEEKIITKRILETVKSIVSISALEVLRISSSTAWESIGVEDAGNVTFQVPLGSMSTEEVVVKSVLAGQLQVDISKISIEQIEFHSIEIWILFANWLWPHLEAAAVHLDADEFYLYPPESPQLMAEIPTLIDMNINTAPPTPSTSVKSATEVATPLNAQDAENNFFKS